MPVIHVSAHAVDVVDRAQGLTRGADAYLAEPIEPEELVATAHAVLRYYQARQRAELLAERLAGLAEADGAVHAAPNFVRLLEAAAAGAAEIFKSPAAVIAETFDGDCLAGVVRRAGRRAAHRPVGGRRHRGADRRDRAGGGARRLGLGRLAGGDTVTVAAARLREDRAPLYVVVPTATQTARTPVLVQLAQAVAAAVEAQRSFDEEHRIAVTLQRSLLPRRLPEVAGLDLAVRYEPASAQTEVGGDFYELVMLDGHLLMAIGDVAGHSLHAATVMAELRHAVRAYAVEGHQPGGILHRVNELMRTLLPNELATHLRAAAAPASGRIRLASAGHLPPLISMDGKVEFVQHSRRCSASAPRARRPGVRAAGRGDAGLLHRRADRAAGHHHRRGAGRAGRGRRHGGRRPGPVLRSGCWWSWPRRRSRTTSPWSSCAAAELSALLSSPSGRTRRGTPRPRR